MKKGEYNVTLIKEAKISEIFQTFFAHFFEDVPLINNKQIICLPNKVFPPRAPPHTAAARPGPMVSLKREGR